MKYLKSILFLLLPFYGQAQQVLEAGVFGGGTNYLGDLAEAEVQLSESHFAYGVFLKYYLNDHFSIKPSLIKSTISGDDSHNSRLQSRNFSFYADLFEAAIRMEWYPIGLRKTKKYRSNFREISPYVFAGVGFTLADAQVQTGNVAIELLKEPFPEEGDRSTFLTTPYGGGLRVAFFKPLIVDFEFGWRPVHSDYLDGISKNARPDRNDWYIMGGINVSYLLGQEVVCKF